MAEAKAGGKARGGRTVPSRYLNYDQKTAGKAHTSQLGSKAPERGSSAKKPPPQLQKEKSSLEMTLGVLQSTMLEGHENPRPNLEVSLINDKTRPVKQSLDPNAAKKNASGKKQALVSADPEDLARMLESQTLLLTYASVKVGDLGARAVFVVFFKSCNLQDSPSAVLGPSYHAAVEQMEKKLALLEEKAERDLLALSQERDNLQREVDRKKFGLLQLKKEKELSDALDKQLEVLAPIAEKCARFQEEYKHFATALDSTRHELPTKGIHLGEHRHQFLADLQEQLTATESVLKANLQENSTHNAQVLGSVQDLEEASLKLKDELPRSIASLLNLSAGVSKEVSLNNQKACEDAVGLEAVKQWYFP